MAKWNFSDDIEKIAYIMIGIPGSGKSSYIKKLKEIHPVVSIISFDNVVNKIADDHGISYEESYANYQDMINDEFRQQVSDIFVKLPNVVIRDMTNVHKKSRSTFANRLKQSGYKIVYVLFKKPSNSKEANEWFTRVDSRKDKIIRDSVLIGFYQDFQYPDTENEPCDEIVVVKDPWKKYN